MMIEFPEYDYVVIRQPGSGASDVHARDIVTAFYQCGFWLSRWQRLEDRGDRVGLADHDPYLRSPSRRDFVFLLNGEVHVPAYEVIAIHAAYFERVRQQSLGGRKEAQRGRAWSRHKLRVHAPSLGNERRGNLGVETDETVKIYGIRIRAKRRLETDIRFSNGDRNERNWKRFRRTRWR